ncbi:hypothetical protein AKJ09_05510 [Labilithrix luteola]|uniref:Uncharacterized protein n=1 Tax=Labilithrix luteola TaxID=1391654 RepID=A0A0K1PZN9_9BACT|nr:hypothetical protein [Labilithrix luteola]AKU98846.1 hypothetical protein AKJ09_05510 [Labilithrix luteola]
MVLYRQLFRLYTSRHEKDAFADRILRESSTLRAAADVWSDVASNLGLGFRVLNGGPVIHGELRSGAELEIGIYETDDGAYRTLASTEGGRGPMGRVLVKRHDALSRIKKVVSRAPEGLDEELRAGFSVTASPSELAKELLSLPAAKALFVDLSDRSPRLSYRTGSASIVLEGVELAHQRLELVIEALTQMTSSPTESHSAFR